MLQGVSKNVNKTYREGTFGNRCVYFYTPKINNV